MSVVVFKTIFNGWNKAPDVFHANDAICEPLCAAHDIFGLTYMDQWSCTSCFATSEVAMCSEFMFRVYVAQAAEIIHKYQVIYLILSSYLNYTFFLPSFLLLSTVFCFVFYFSYDTHAFLRPKQLRKLHGLERLFITCHLL